jgi:chemotaxis protein MotA
MFVIVGFIIVIAGVLLGYTLHEGQVMLLWQPTEFLIIGGAALGGMLIANPLPTTIGIIKGILRSFKGAGPTKEAYLELLKLLYELFQLAKRDGLIALEPHVENPHSSPIFSKYPHFLANQHAVDFLCDTMKVVLNGGIPAHDLEELMDIDLESAQHEMLKPPTALATVADSFPGLGIVAAVLGVVITMGKIDQPPEVIGHSVAAALVGTFLGVLLSYGFVGPLARNLENAARSDHHFLICIKAAILAFARGVPSVVAIEYGRRAIEPHERPSFQETEEAVKSVR